MKNRKLLYKNCSLVIVLLMSMLLIACSCNDTNKIVYNTATTDSKNDIKDDVADGKETTNPDDIDSSSDDEATDNNETKNLDTTKDNSIKDSTDSVNDTTQNTKPKPSTTKSTTEAPTTQPPTSPITTPSTNTSTPKLPQVSQTTQTNIADDLLVATTLKPTTTFSTVSQVRAQIVESMKASNKGNKTIIIFNYADKTIVSSDTAIANFLDAITKGIPELCGSTNISAKTSGNKAIVTLTFVHNDKYSILQAYQSGNTSKLSSGQLALYNKCVQIIDSIITSSMNDFQKEIAIHDYIVSYCEYDNSIRDESHYGRTCLLKGYAVCDGYSEAFELLCGFVGIQTQTVTGTGNKNGSSESHAWNLVKLGGEWYHVDVTWDDPIVSYGSDSVTKQLLSSYIRHGYTNLSAAQIKTDHTWEEVYTDAATTATNYNYFNQVTSNFVNSQAELNSLVNSAIDKGTKQLLLINDSNYDIASAVNGRVGYSYATSNDRNYKIVAFSFNY